MSPNLRLAFIALLAASAACSDGQEPTPPSRIASITFDRDSVVLDPGGRYVVPSPEARDTNGQVLTDVTYAWRSGDPDVATVDATGRLVAISVGETTVSASAEGASGSFTVVVVPSYLGSVELLSVPATLLPGGAVQVIAQFRDTAGRPAAPPRDEVVWSSSDSATARVQPSENPEGPVRAVAISLQAGHAVITARRGPLSASATLRIEPESFLAVAAGGAEACAITASHRTYCWGESTIGQLGGGLPDLRCGDLGYCSAVPLLVHGQEQFERLALSGTHSCGITIASEPFCWGGGLVNDMRRGSIECLPVDLDPGIQCIPEPRPIELAGPAAAVAPGGDFGCVLDRQGVVRCWGDARGGGLGTANAPDLCTEHPPGSVSEFPCSRNPVEIDDPGPFAALETGGHACGLTPDGEARCWGGNRFGQLGRGGTSTGELPAPVSGGLHFDQISVGGSHTCALASGTAYCWGWNGEGQLGSTLETSCSDTEPAACEPVPVPGHLFTRISAGSANTCALDAAGTAWCWGWNATGALGNGTTESTTTPVAVSAGLVFQDISAGGAVTCGYTTDGEAYCWGDTLGIVDGVADHPVPTKVPGQL
jgi:alpha-tubulin suppressor-like RCC1 family protein